MFAPNSSKDGENLRNGLLKSVKRWFVEDRDSWFLQEDNDSMETMDWPASSPDANPMENVCHLMKVKNLQGQRLFNLQRLARHIREFLRG